MPRSWTLPLVFVVALFVACDTPPHPPVVLGSTPPAGSTSCQCESDESELSKLMERVGKLEAFVERAGGEPGRLSVEALADTVESLSDELGRTQADVAENQSELAKLRQLVGE